MFAPRLATTNVQSNGSTRCSKMAFPRTLSATVHATRGATVTHQTLLPRASPSPQQAVENKIGKQEPARFRDPIGFTARFWDPTGFTANGGVESLQRHRQTGIKHRRIAMLVGLEFAHVLEPWLVKVRAAVVPIFPMSYPSNRTEGGGLPRTSSKCIPKVELSCQSEPPCQQFSRAVFSSPASYSC
jgi:hypothetical protein